MVELDALIPDRVVTSLDDRRLFSLAVEGDFDVGVEIGDVGLWIWWLDGDCGLVGPEGAAGSGD